MNKLSKRSLSTHDEDLLPLFDRNLPDHLARLDILDWNTERDDVVLSSDSKSLGSRREPSKRFSDDLLRKNGREAPQVSQPKRTRFSEIRHERRRGRGDR